MENLRQVHSRVAAHGERQARLPRKPALVAGDQESASIENGCERRYPRFVVVLRAEVAHDWIGDVAFQNFRRPALPFVQELLERFHALRARVTPQKLRGGRRRARARVEQHDTHFTP